MDVQELRRRISHIQLTVKRLMASTFSGNFTSAFKGAGLEFSQLREYQPGDEVRTIDWKSSAKMNKLMIKEFMQEKERTVIIALDISRSLSTTSTEQQKRAYAQDCAASLSMIAQKSNDKVGLLLFDHEVVSFVPPRKGMGHNAVLLKTIFTSQSRVKSRESGLGAALQFLANQRCKNAILFLISDFVHTSIADQSLYTKTLGSVARRYETVAVRVHDRHEERLPSLGLLPVVDPETGEHAVLATEQVALKSWLEKQWRDHERVLKKHRIDTVALRTDISLIDTLTSFFYTRSH